MKSGNQVRHVDVVSTSSASKEKSSGPRQPNGSKPQMLMAPSSSLSTLHAKKARAIAHKQLLKNVSVLAAQKIKVERLLHECLKGASALQVATDKSNDVIWMLKSSKDSYDKQIVQFSLLPSYVHSSPTREHQKLCEQAHFEDDSTKQPFTVHKAKLELYRRRRDECEASSTSRGASVSSTKNVLIDALTTSDAAAVMEHSAMAEILSEDLSNFIASEGKQCREELSQMNLRLQAMKNLIHCATDAEVQVLHNTFPCANHIRSLENDYEHTQMKRGDGALAGGDEKILFVNASPMFPDMTLADFPQMASECDVLTGRAKRITAALIKSSVEYRERCNRSERNVRCALERGKKLADTKRLSSEIHLRATEAEEQQLRQKKSELVQCVANLSSRLECVDSSIRMRDTLYSGVGSFATVSSPKGQRPVTAISELLVVLNGERSKSQSASPQQHESAGFGPVILRADSPSAQRSPKNVLPNADCEDVVFLALMEEKRQLLLRTAELGEKINQIDDQLWKISMEKKRYRHDVKQADWRSAACGAVASSPTSAERQRQHNAE